MKTLKYLPLALAAAALVVAPAAEASKRHKKRIELPKIAVVLQDNEQNSSANSTQGLPAGHADIDNGSFLGATGLFNIANQAGAGNQANGQNGLAKGELALVKQSNWQVSQGNRTSYAMDKKRDRHGKRDKKDKCDCLVNGASISNGSFAGAVGMFNVANQAGNGNQASGQNGIAVAGH